MEYTKPPPTTTQLRGEVFNMMVAHKKQIAFFKTLIDDEEGQSPFEGIENSYQALYEAFLNFQYKVQKVLDEPHKVTHINQDEIINIYDTDTPSVQAIEVNLQQQSGTWIELENGDFLDISKIDYLAAQKRLILFSNGKWSKPTTLTTKDLARIKYAIRFNLFK